MKEILFRGKRIDNYVNDKSIDYTETGAREWVYGDIIHRRYYKNKDVIVIRTEDSGFDNYSDYEVDQETVGQCVPNLVDKTGKKIFEGDIVEAVLEGKYENTVIRGTVEPPNGGTYIFKDTQGRDLLLGQACWEKCVTVIGNIYDNPELLDEGNYERYTFSRKTD